MNRLSVFGLAAALWLSTPALAHDDHGHDQAHSHDHHAAAIEAGDLVISGTFTRATNPGAPVAGGYFDVTNNGETDDRLIAVEADISEHVEIHEMTHVDDVMRMQELPDGLPVPAGETVTLGPGGYHLMFMNLNTALVEGEAIDVILVFENSGRIEARLPVLAAGARGIHDDEYHEHAH